MRRVFTVVLALVMVISLVACGRKKKSEAAEKADKLILAIGTVSLDSEPDIEKAEEAVKALTSEELKDLENYDLLKEKRSEYDDLVVKAEEERVVNLVTNERWYGVYDGDEYSFRVDGTGSHDGTTLEYKLSDETISVSEGAAGTIKKTFAIDESGNYTKLIESGSEDSYYVRASDYDAISEEIQAEYTKILCEYGYWQFISPDLGYHLFLFTFSTGNNSVCVTSDLFGGDGTSMGTWLYEDNNTIKVSFSYQGENVKASYDIVYDGGVYKLVTTNDNGTYAIHKSV